MGEEKFLLFIVIGPGDWNRADFSRKSYTFRVGFFAVSLMCLRNIAEQNDCVDHICYSENV